ncbi:MAG: glycosyltransferase family 9 protein [Candidatus Krumholzibacteriia bacterium]
MRREEPPRILVILFGLVGDTLMRVPLVRALRRRHPDAFIVAVCDPPLVDALAANPLFDEVRGFDRHGTTYAQQVRSYLKLRRLRLDLSVDMYFGARTPVLAWFAGDRRRLGLGNYWYGKLLLTDVVDPQLPLAHMVDRHLPLLEPLGITELERVWEFPVTPATATAAAARLKLAGLPLPGAGDVIVAVGAGDETKRWDETLLDEIVARLGETASRVFLVADAQQPDLTERRGARAGALSLPPLSLPPLSLPHLAALFARAGLVITPDSGLMHVALATAPRLLTFFQSTHPEWHSARRPAYRYLYRENCPVQPCDTRLKHTCGHECRRSLSAGDVLAAAAELRAGPAWDGTWPANRVSLADVRRDAAAAEPAASPPVT